ncbi:hypothetical protein NQ038_07500 [Brevibacterium sp. 50QC2O2]|uniref:hypothetical protein n=1 Tax=Brevibacterium sp. 50QC2O2 TaxID=2968459 RepID=UPI00211D1502|nr:hypothetical protein [Brevibacterium sp. 50QC2O2]MCQ9388490.1 hypothetical protein [Brevibacterium sp. 50QC2O2]
MWGDEPEPDPDTVFGEEFVQVQPRYEIGFGHRVAAIESASRQDDVDGVPAEETAGPVAQDAPAHHERGP